MYKVKKIIKKFLKHKNKISKGNNIYQINKKFNLTKHNSECVILGNGPSLRKVDFNQFKGIDVFTVNQISRHKDFDKLHINFHLWADPMFFEEKNGEKMISDEFFNHMVKVIVNNKNINLFVSSSPNNPIVKQLKNYTENIYYFKSESCDTYSGDLSTSWPSFYNVIQFAIYAAICMGYSKIYLFGCDQTGIYNILDGKLKQKASNNYYGYNVSEIEKKRMVYQYNRYPLSLWLSQHAQMFKDFDKLNEFAINKGVKIYNCTAETLCDSFEKKLF